MSKKLPITLLALVAFFVLGFSITANAAGKEKTETLEVLITTQIYLGEHPPPSD